MFEVCWGGTFYVRAGLAGGGGGGDDYEINILHTYLYRKKILHMTTGEKIKHDKTHMLKGLKIKILDVPAHGNARYE